MKRLLVACCALAAGWGGVAGADQPDEPVGLFAAIEAGQLEARIIPRDSRQCRLMLTNRTGQPLHVALPAALAAVPVLAQFQGFDAGNQGGPQQLGVGGPQQGNVFGGGQNGNNFFSIPPEKTCRLRLPAVCLDHGRPNPQPQIPYALRPIEEVTTRPGVAEICARLGRGELDQAAAQAAAWHLNNGLSWDELARQKTGPIFDAPLFTARQLRDARRAVALVEKAASPAEPSLAQQ